MDHPADAVEQKVARPVAFSLAWTLSVGYEHNQVYVYFILKLYPGSEVQDKKAVLFRLSGPLIQGAKAIEYKKQLFVNFFNYKFKIYFIATIKNGFQLL